MVTSWVHLASNPFYTGHTLGQKMGTVENYLAYRYIIGVKGWNNPVNTLVYFSWDIPRIVPPIHPNYLSSDEIWSHPNMEIKPIDPGPQQEVMTPPKRIFPSPVKRRRRRIWSWTRSSSSSWTSATNAWTRWTCERRAETRRGGGVLGTMARR